MFELFKRFILNRSKGFYQKERNKRVSLKHKDGVEDIQVSQSRYLFASCQSTGIERTHNEDTLFTLYNSLDGMEPSVSFGIFLVADGMGGHQSGEIASHLAAQGISQHLVQWAYEHYLFQHNSLSIKDIEDVTREAVSHAQSLILRRVPGGGTTLTMVLLLGDQFISANVGDSRMYRIGNDGKLNLITRDHSLVNRLVDLGEISIQEASSHPQRNVLYRALGQTDPFEPDIEHFTIETGERLMLCSDGLWGVLSEYNMLNIIQSGATLDSSACALVDAANDSGGPDNISVILIERIS